MIWLALSGFGVATFLCWVVCRYERALFRIKHDPETPDRSRDIAGKALL